MRSPLKEANGGSKALHTVKALIPAGSIVNSFGLFDGNIEVDLAFNQRFVIARTSKYVIYEFWHTLLHNPMTVAQIAQSLFPVKQEAIFNILQENWPKYKDPHLRSAIFFLLNRCSDTGLLSAGQMTNESFNTLALTMLKNFKIDNFHLLFDQDEDLGHLLSEIPVEEYVIFPGLNFSFNLLDHGKIRSFETTPINHAELKKAIDTLEHKILLIYRYHPRLFSLYKDYKTMMIDKYGQQTTNDKKCREVIVANF
jgi:hypothetical protein